ncbi:hypothetical protein [Streptomyces sp. NPDC014995]
MPRLANASYDTVLTGIAVGIGFFVLAGLFFVLAGRRDARARE